MSDKARTVIDGYDIEPLMIEETDLDKVDHPDPWRVWLFVPGLPAPQGSKRHVGRGILIESSKALGPWRETVKLAAHTEMIKRNLTMREGVPLSVDIRFVMPRPKSLPKTRVTKHVKRPDIDKLARAVLDGLTNVVFADDSAVWALGARKRYAELGETPGCGIVVVQR